MLSELEALGRAGLIGLLGALVLFIAWKAWQRQRFIRLIRMARISVPELRDLIDGGHDPLIVDVRPAALRDASGWIPGAILAERVAELDVEPQHEVVVYCDCPNEASAARIARELKNRGFRHVRPLAGGLAAWSAQGLPLARGRAPDGSGDTPAARLHRPL